MLLIVKRSVKEKLRRNLSCQTELEEGFIFVCLKKNEDRILVKKYSFLLKIFFCIENLLRLAVIFGLYYDYYIYI